MTPAACQVERWECDQEKRQLTTLTFARRNFKEAMRVAFAFLILEELRIAPGPFVVSRPVARHLARLFQLTLTRQATGAGPIIAHKTRWPTRPFANLSQRSGDLDGFS